MYIQIRGIFLCKIVITNLNKLWKIQVSYLLKKSFLWPWHPHTVAFCAYGIFWMFYATIFIPGSGIKKRWVKVEISSSDLQMYAGRPGKDAANGDDVIFPFLDAFLIM